MKLIKTLIGVFGGATAGLLFAQKSGKELRKDLLKDKDKMLEVLGKEFVSVGKEISEEVQKIAETEDAQELIQAAKSKFKGITELAKKEGGGFAVEVEKYLAEISKYTKQKAGEIENVLNKAKKTINKKTTKAKKTATKKATSTKNKVAKKVINKADTAKKAVSKKADAAKKTADKTTKAVQKTVKKTAKKAATATKKAGKAVKGILM